MAPDRDLPERIRELIGGTRGLTERRMFGGIAFLLDGNRAVTASGRGGLMVRVDPAESAALQARTNAVPMVMKGKPMRGWLHVDTADVRTKRQLEPWVRRGMTYAAGLPPKGTSRGPRSTTGPRTSWSWPRR
jgi:hypothetical protein